MNSRFQQDFHKTEESMQLALCTICNLFIRISQINSHTLSCMNEKCLKYNEINEINRQVNSIQENCIIVLSDLNPLLVKYKSITRICEICSIINQIESLNILSQKLIQNLQTELTILQRLNQQSITIQVFVSRLEQLLDEKIGILSDTKIKSPKQSSRNGQTIQLSRKQNSNQQVKTESSELMRTRFNSKESNQTKKKELFYTKYLVQSKQLDINSPARKITADFLFQTAINDSISPREWDIYIIKQFAAMERRYRNK